MAADDKREQKAMLLLEIEESEADLAAIREKANELLARFQEIVAVLEYAKTQSARPVNLATRRDPKEDLLERIQSRERYRVVNRESAVLLVKELSDARAKLDILRQRKASLTSTV